MPTKKIPPQERYRIALSNKIFSKIPPTVEDLVDINRAAMRGAVKQVFVESGLLMGKNQHIIKARIKVQNMLCKYIQQKIESGERKINTLEVAQVLMTHFPELFDNKKEAKVIAKLICARFDGIIKIATGN